MLRRSLAFLFLCLALGCGDDGRRPLTDGSPSDAEVPPADATGFDAFLDPDASCATATAGATLDADPVDIIWMVDNSTSMEPAIREVEDGLNEFASRIAGSGLDYRVIMLSQQGESTGSSLRVCIPPPLAGDSSCGDGERFFHVAVDIRSTQQVEQFLGTLAQTEGYAEGDSRGSRPWRDLLRPNATKTIVVVTDDNSRTCANPHSEGVNCDSGDAPLTDLSLENYPGGNNPFSDLIIGPGILTAEYGDLFEGYTFNGIYGWGSTSNPEVSCESSIAGFPAKPGQTYTALVERTGGVRAQICDQSDSAAWDSFFDAVAETVASTARIACTLPLPVPPGGMMLNPRQVNVFLSAGGASDIIPKVSGGAASCGPTGGWFYDDDANPTTVELCPATCDLAQRALEESGDASVDVQFGCDTILI
ncbi:MAG: hypothetical protein CMN30_26370 [Sandaracinus sp.]|nr:hypothetical protein [Sandaracinus sp.]